MKPVIKRAGQWDGKGYRPKLEDAKKWVIDFTAVYPDKFNWPKLRMTWFFDGRRYRNKEKVLTGFMYRLAKNRIAFAYVHKTWPPADAEKLNFIMQANRQLAAARQERTV